MPGGSELGGTRSYASSWRARAPASPPALPAAESGDPSPATPRLQPHAPRHRSPPPQRAPHPREFDDAELCPPTQLNAYVLRLRPAASSPLAGTATPTNRPLPLLDVMAAVSAEVEITLHRTTYERAAPRAGRARLRWVRRKRAPDSAQTPSSSDPAAQPEPGETLALTRMRVCPVVSSRAAWLVYRLGPVRGTTEPPAASSGASRAWSLVLLLGACALAFMAVAGLSPRPAGGELAQAGEAVIGVSGETVPGKLPRSHMVPATLRLGFTSKAPSAPTTPELTTIRLEISHHLALWTAKSSMRARGQVS